MSQHPIYLFFISIISRARRTSSAVRQPWQRLALIPHSVYIAARGVLITFRLIACCCGYSVAYPVAGHRHSMARRRRTKCMRAGGRTLWYITDVSVGGIVHCTILLRHTAHPAATIVGCGGLWRHSFAPLTAIMYNSAPLPDACAMRGCPLTAPPPHPFLPHAARGVSRVSIARAGTQAPHPPTTATPGCCVSALTPSPLTAARRIPGCYHIHASTHPNTTARHYLAIVPRCRVF